MKNLVPNYAKYALIGMVFSFFIWVASLYTILLITDNKVKATYGSLIISAAFLIGFTKISATLSKERIEKPEIGPFDFFKADNASYRKTIKNELFEFTRWLNTNRELNYWSGYLSLFLTILMLGLLLLLAVYYT